MKIDLSLVQGGVMRDSALAVLSAIQDIAARADATVIAEGIETVDQLDVIREVGITRGQGYLLANPAPELQPEPIDIERLLESHQARRQALLGTWGAPVKSLVQRRLRRWLSSAHAGWAVGPRGPEHLRRGPRPRPGRPLHALHA